MSGIHQFVPMLHRGDAVGRHTLALRDLFVARGISSRIYVELVDPDTHTQSEPFLSYAGHAEHGDVLLYQFATATGMAPWLESRPETLVVNYHNITPPEHYAAWDNGLARHQVLARSQLAGLAHRAALGIAVSRYNEADLVEAGFARTAVVPPAAVLAPAHPTPGPGRTPSEGGARWLSVGRVAPNKAIEHAVMALLLTREHVDPRATLSVVGRAVVPSYTGALSRFVADLGLRGAVEFAGPLTDAALAARMGSSDVLVVTSLHEGFGVPLVEAMAAGLPVVANATGALPEVVGQGGLLVDTSDPWLLSAAVARAVGDPTVRAGLVEAGRAQLAALDLETAGPRLADLVTPLLGR